MMVLILLLAVGALLLTGCDPDDMRRVADVYLPESAAAEQVAYADHLARVMPYYVTGALFSAGLVVAAIANGLEHARSLGRSESIRYGAYLALLSLIALFVAMAFDGGWIRPGQPLVALGITAALSAGGTLLVARPDPDRAVLRAGYLAATLGLPLVGLLVNRDVYLIDTTASLFIGQAVGLLLVIVLSDPIRVGLVDFLRRKEDTRPGG